VKVNRDDELQAVLDQADLQVRWHVEALEMELFDLARGEGKDFDLEPGQALLQALYCGFKFRDVLAHRRGGLVEFGERVG